MKRINWDLMRPQDIEVRPAMIKDGKATLLLYQDSRNTMDALDRNFGEFGWKIEYKDVGGQTYGCLSILNEDTGEWICKEDTGEESNIAAKKGMSSDILKRCAVRFGYGRELYSAPKIVVDDNGYGCSGYRVGAIEYNENREITHLEVTDRFGNLAFTWTVGYTAADTADNKPKKDNRTILTEFCTEKKHTTTDKDELLKFYNFYIGKCDGWRQEFQVGKLWERWVNTKR